MVISLYEKEREYKDRISKKFMVALNYYFDDFLMLNPEHASSLGLTRHDKDSKDYSDAGYEKDLHLNLETKKKIRLINPFNLSLDEHVDFLLLKSRIDCFLFDHENLIQKRKNRPQLYLPTDSIYPFLFRTMKDKDRLEAIIARLSKVPKKIEQAKQNLDNPPRIWTEDTLKLLKPVKDFFKSLPDAEVIKNSARDYSELGNKLVEANNTCLTALEAYEHFLNVDLMERSHGEFCVGRQVFDHYLINHHFLEHSSGYLNELGYELFNKTQADIKALASHIDKNKSTEALMSELESQIVPADKLLSTYKDLTEKTLNFVKDNNILEVPKNEKVLVVETPEFFRSIIPFAAYYCVWPYEESDTGHFWVTPVTESDPEIQRQLLMDGHNLYRLPSIVLHESYPGHHHQLMFTKQHVFGNEISTIRRDTFNTILLEGWATYCEQMMGEFGFYSDQQKLFMLKQRLWRAARVIIDIELHTGRKSFEESVAFLVNKVGMSEKFARAEVLRYTMTPTQPLSYEIGRRLINQLRDKEKIKRQEDFSIKQFHAKLLSKGTLPIRLIEELAFNDKVEVKN
ncbi:MAG: DUF885 domain-containing protein [Cyanobacteriota bacterium]